MVAADKLQDRGMEELVKTWGWLLVWFGIIAAIAAGVLSVLFGVIVAIEATTAAGMAFGIVLAVFSETIGGIIGALFFLPGKAMIDEANASKVRRYRASRYRQTPRPGR